MRCEDFQYAARLRDAMQLVYKSKHVRHVLDHVTTKDLFEFVIGKRIWKRTEIVDDVCMTATVRIDADSAGKFILTATDIENLFL